MLLGHYIALYEQLYRSIRRKKTPLVVRRAYMKQLRGLRGIIHRMSAHK
jgi:hypothetical protein